MMWKFWKKSKPPTKPDACANSPKVIPCPKCRSELFLQLIEYRQYSYGLRALVTCEKGHEIFLSNEDLEANGLIGLDQ
jgi:hypothetical protein